MATTSSAVKQLSDNNSQGTVLGQSATDKIAFYGTTAVTQFGAQTTPNTHTVTTGATTSVFVNSTFDGGTGSSAYSVGDIVLALKKCGLIAA